MAHHASAKKRIRQNIKRRQRNRLVVTAMRTKIKRFRKAVEDGDRRQAEELLMPAVQGLDRAATKGCIHWRAAARGVSRLHRALAKVQ